MLINSIPSKFIHSSNIIMNYLMKKIKKLLLKKKKRRNSSFGNNYEEFFLPERASFLSEDRMHLSHCLMREIWNGNFSAPIKSQLINGAKVLDVGCGSGSWICEMSSEYPDSRFIGLDILNLFPKIKPSNVEFVQRDLFNGLPFSDNTFDYVHMQTLIFDVTETQWEQFVYRELARVCKVGGWIEIVDPELDFHRSGPITDHVNRVIRTKFHSRMVNTLITSRHKSLLKLTPHLTNIHHEKRKYTLGNWSGKIGDLCSSFAKETYRSFLLSLKKKNQIVGLNDKLLKSNGITNNVDDIIRKVGDEFEIHKTWLFIHKFYVQKFKDF